MNYKSILLTLCSVIIVSISYYICTVRYPIPKTMPFLLDSYYIPLLYKQTIPLSVTCMRPRSRCNLSYLSSSLYHYTIPYYTYNNTEKYNLL